jgi:hypothetical protein
VANLYYVGSYPPVNANELIDRQYLDSLLPQNLTQAQVDTLVAAGFAPYATKAYVDTQDALNATKGYIDGIPQWDNRIAYPHGAVVEYGETYWTAAQAVPVGDPPPGSPPSPPGVPPEWTAVADPTTLPTWNPNGGDADRLHLYQINVAEGVPGLDASGRIDPARIDIPADQMWPLAIFSPPTYNTTTVTTVGFTETVVYSFTIPDPGYLYQIEEIFGMCDAFTAIAGAPAILRVRLAYETGAVIAMGYSSGDTSCYDTVDLVPSYEKLYTLQGNTALYVTVAGSAQNPGIATASNASQQFNLFGATGGSYTLDFGPLGSLTIPWNATTQYLQNALAGLVGIGNTVVSAVTGAGAGLGNNVITFVNNLGQQYIAPVVVDTTALLGTLPSTISSVLNAGGLSLFGAPSTAPTDAVTALNPSMWISTVEAAGPVSFLPYSETNTARDNYPVPVGDATHEGCSGCWVSLIGGGAGGGAGGLENPQGGSGGGGAAKVGRSWIPVSDLGADYSVSIGVGGAGGTPPVISGQGHGTDGTASSFSSGSVNLVAEGGGHGWAVSTAGGLGGTAGASGTSVPVILSNGGGGGAGITGTPIVGGGGQGGPGNSTNNGAAAGGGAGGAAVPTIFGIVRPGITPGGNGGSVGASAPGGAGAPVVTFATATLVPGGNDGNDGQDGGPGFGGGGGGGGGGTYFGAGGDGGNGGTPGGGGGGGGCGAGIELAIPPPEPGVGGGPAGNGGNGWTLVEWA